MTTYEDSGVDPKRAEEVLKGIDNIGGFGAVIPIDTQMMGGMGGPGRNLVMGTDGVGTKVLIAEALGKFDTIGIDLVAMCVNDVLCHGAAPFAFLDYYATGRLDVEKSQQILAGIQRGCEIAGCELVGGETAEMPGVYSGTQFDLAGFCVGIIHQNFELPRLDTIEEGDNIIGIPSSGFHSNGYSLIRKVCDDRGLDYPEHLLTPTRIYVDDVTGIIPYAKSIAHITGGGIHGNLPRALPDHLTYDLRLPAYPQHFRQMREFAEMTCYEMESTFNCGWGMMIVIRPSDTEHVFKAIPDAKVLGCVTTNK